MNELSIKKVKIIPKHEKIVINYAVNGDEMQGQFNEPAAPEFYECFEQLVAPVCEIMELSPDDFYDRIEPFGITFSHGDGVTRVSISSKLHMPVSDTDTVVNTPTRKVSLEYEDGLEPSTCKIIDKLEDEAKKYINGQRAQMNLFEQETGGQNVTPAPMSIEE